MDINSSLSDELTVIARWQILTQQYTIDEIRTVWVDAEDIVTVLQHFKSRITKPFEFLYDLCAIDERSRRKIKPAHASDFTIVYHSVFFRTK